MNPYLHAGVASAYISGIVLFFQSGKTLFPDGSEIAGAFIMLSLLVLSVAVMGYLFFYGPLTLFLEGKQREAMFFFFRTVGTFAVILGLFGALLVRLS